MSYTKGWNDFKGIIHCIGNNIAMLINIITCITESQRANSNTTEFMWNSQSITVILLTGQWSVLHPVI